LISDKDGSIEITGNTVGGKIEIKDFTVTLIVHHHHKQNNDYV